MKHPIGYREIHNSHLIPLCEKIIRTISEERIKRVNTWAEDYVKRLNKRNWLNNNIWFLKFEDYTVEQVKSKDWGFDFCDPDMWDRIHSETWADELMEICQVSYTAIKNSPNDTTLLDLEKYSRMLKFVDNWVKE